MPIRRRRRCCIGHSAVRCRIGAEGAIHFKHAEHRGCSSHQLRHTGLRARVPMRLRRRAFRVRNHAITPTGHSPQMRKGRNRANSDLLFVSADDLEKNPEHENEPRWQPKPAKIIKVTPQKADFRLRKCQGVKCDQTGDSAAGTDTGNGGSRGRCNVQDPQRKRQARSMRYSAAGPENSPHHRQKREGNTCCRRDERSRHGEKMT